MSKYDEYRVVSQLNQKNDLLIENGQIKELLPPKSKGDVGIKSRGKIDYLRGLGYTHFYVEKFDK